jgi:rhamnosyl/mannosyltransferase
VRVAHFFKDFWPPLAAGITRYLADVTDESTRRGLDVEVHVAGVRRSRRDVLPSGVVVHRHRELGRLLSSPIAPGLVREAKTVEADVVHLHMPNPLGELGAVLGRATRPVVVSFHAQLGRQKFLEPIYRPLQQKVLAQAAAVLVSNEGVAMAPELEAIGHKVRLLPYGVSPRFSRAEAPVGSSGHAVRVLFVGRLVYYKGIDVLLKAAAQLSDVSVTVVGQGPLRQELECIACELGLRDSVRFLGAVDDDALLQAYASHDVFVLPSVSRAEAFGLAMAEAMASGLPAVSTSLGTGTDWVNQHEESGLVVPPDDVDALVKALERLREPDERRRFSEGARTRAASLFSFERHCDALLEVYQEVGR